MEWGGFSDYVMQGTSIISSQTPGAVFLQSGVGIGGQCGQSIGNLSMKKFYLLSTTKKHIDITSSVGPRVVRWSNDMKHVLNVSSSIRYTPAAL